MYTDAIELKPLLIYQHIGLDDHCINRQRRHRQNRRNQALRSAHVCYSIPAPITGKLIYKARYQYSTCDPTRNAKATIEALVNHNNITAYLDLWKPQIAAARGLGKEFVIGEYK